MLQLIPGGFLKAGDAGLFTSVDITDGDTGYQIGGVDFLRAEGVANVLLGANVAANFTGAFNVYIGDYAGQGNTPDINNTGSRNVGLGVYTFYHNTNGSENMAIGYGALYENTGGWYNVAIGKDACSQNTDAGRSVGIGLSALYNVSSGGGNNVGIGYNAGKGVAGNDFEDNVLIGSHAGYRLTTGSRSIFIGYASGARQTALSDRLIIDSWPRASVAVEQTNSIIFGVMAALPADQDLTFNANIFLSQVKSGATQVASGAAVNEIWKTNGHASLPDNVLMIAA